MKKKNAEPKMKRKSLKLTKEQKQKRKNFKPFEIENRGALKSASEILNGKSFGDEVSQKMITKAQRLLDGAFARLIVLDKSVKISSFEEKFVNEILK